ncbi:uncharacterized protein TA20840 [Theileria annulata]|uniref:Uncharacterized protein n=1 Tax=Theileria annulata TaxID=5874 RepID=Q4UGY7_THEAN|nr:uncharacterized protein TA20840 [Theileria annulata]CAI73652.1 hypothetical protein, conserved [Theileria annulata]|eukprot:XP_954329.1 hypothetical protein, conserved [Theileria annulata]
MECIIRELELLLLDPCNDLNGSRIDKIKQLSENNVVDKLSKIIELVLSVKNVDLYSSIILLEELFEKPILINDNISLWDKSNYFNYISQNFTEFLENSNDFDDFQLNSFILLCTIVLCINVVIRANWIGPKFSLQTSQKTLSNKFKNHIERAESSNTLDENDNELNLKTVITWENLNLIKNLDDNNNEKCYLLGAFYEDLSEKVVLKSPELSLTDLELDEKSKEFLKQMINEFVIDGETIYEGTLGLQYLFNYQNTSNVNTNTDVISSENTEDSINNVKIEMKSKEIWRSRIGYIYQLMIEDSGLILCPKLYHCSIINFLHYLRLSNVLEEYDVYNIDVNDGSDSILKSVLMRKPDLGMEFDDYFKSLLLIELLQRLPIYNLNRLYKPVSENLTKYLNFSFEFTGKLGVRRKFQSFSIPQLVLSYSKPFPTNSSPNQKLKCDPNLLDENLENPQEPKDEITVGLNEINEENDIYETPRFDEDEKTEELSDLEQLFLLSKGLNILSTTSKHDQLSLQFLNTISNTILQQSKKRRLIMLMSLWLRCKTEYNRTKTIERATIQLNNILNAYYVTTMQSTIHNLSYMVICTVDDGNRNEYFFQMSYPAIWNIKREIGKYMFMIGSITTACNMYKELHMWEDVIKCLVLTQQKQQANELINERIKIMATPSLYCYLGDISNDIQHYHTAWEMSNERCGRAVRSIGVKYYNSGDFEKALEFLEKSIQLNPMNENVQFIVGCCYLKLLKFENAITPFSRVVSINPDNSDAWANISSAHFKVSLFAMKNYQSGKIAITQALKSNSTRWQFWDILLRISANLNDVKCACNCIQTLINLGMKDKVEVWAVKYLVDSSINELNSQVVDETLKLITSNITESAGVWSEYSRYLSNKEDYVGALESKFKQYRKVEQNIQINLNNPKNELNGSNEQFNELELELFEVLKSMVELANKVDEDDYKKKCESVKKLVDKNNKMALSLYESKASDFAGVDPLSRIFILNIPTHVDNLHRNYIVMSMYIVGRIEEVYNVVGSAETKI